MIHIPISTVTGIELQVCQDIARRQQLGIAKYGQTVADNPLSIRAWLQHAYEECMDQAVYLRRAIEEIDNSPQMVVDLPAMEDDPMVLRSKTWPAAIFPGDTVMLMAVKAAE